MDFVVESTLKLLHERAFSRHKDSSFPSEDILVSLSAMHLLASDNSLASRSACWVKRSVSSLSFLTSWVFSSLLDLWLLMMFFSGVLFGDDGAGAGFAVMPADRRSRSIVFSVLRRRDRLLISSRQRPCSVMS